LVVIIGHGRVAVRIALAGEPVEGVITIRDGDAARVGLAANALRVVRADRAARRGRTAPQSFTRGT
jgi:hypothetical protein